MLWMLGSTTHSQTEGGHKYRTFFWHTRVSRMLTCLIISFYCMAEMHVNVLPLCKQTIGNLWTDIVFAMRSLLKVSKNTVLHGHAYCVVNWRLFLQDQFPLHCTSISCEPTYVDMLVWAADPNVGLSSPTNVLTHQPPQRRDIPGKTVHQVSVFWFLIEY